MCGTTTKVADGDVVAADDAMIAATALANGLAVHTCNPAGFAHLDGLRVVAVPHPDAPSDLGQR